MSNSPVNLHRSMAGFLVGNALAIFVSSIVCLFAWQVTHPEFFKELHEYLRARKEQKKDAGQKDGAKEKTKIADNKNGDPNNSDQEKTEKNQNNKDQNENKNENPRQKIEDSGADPGENGDEQANKRNLTKPEFPITVFGLTIIIDAIFCALAGYVCVIIAGFARNNHGMLMALFVIVWKVQQLVGFVENQLPASLLGIEVIVLPIACIFGASLAGENDTVAEEEFGEDSKADSDSGITKE